MKGLADKLARTNSDVVSKTLEERIEELVKEKEELLTRIHEMMQKMGASEAMLLKERDDYRKRLEEAEAKVITVSNALKMLEENMNRQQEQKFSD